MRKPTADLLQQLAALRREREHQALKRVQAIRPFLLSWPRAQLDWFIEFMWEKDKEEWRPSFLLKLALYLWNLPSELSPATGDLTESLFEWDAGSISGDEFTAAIIHAYKSGLADHPFIQEWLGTRRAVGDWDTLRRGRVRLEKDVKRPLSHEDLIIFRAVAHGQQEGRRSLSSIQQELIRKGLLIGSARKNFNKRVRRLGLPTS